jgi:hypothetical protein
VSTKKVKSVGKKALVVLVTSVGFFSQQASAIVVYDQSIAAASNGTTGYVASIDVAGAIATPNAINSTATSTAPAAVFAPGTNDYALTNAYAAAAGTNKYGLNDVGQGWATGAGYVWKRVGYTADTAGVLTVNTHLAAGSTGVSVGTGAYQNGATSFVWTASLNNIYTHTLNVATAFIRSALITSDLPGIPTVTPVVLGGALNGATTVKTGTEASFSWAATDYVDTVNLAAGQTVYMLYTINETTASIAGDQVLIPGVCGIGNDAAGHSSCGKAWVNLGGNEAFNSTNSSFDFSFAPTGGTGTGTGTGTVPVPSALALILLGAGLLGASKKRTSAAK